MKKVFALLLTISMVVANTSIAFADNNSIAKNTNAVNMKTAAVEESIEEKAEAVNASNDGALRAYVKKQYDTFHTDYDSNSSFLVGLTPSYGTVITQGSSIKTTFKIRDTYKYYYTSPIISLIDENDQIVYATFSLGKIPADNYWHSYSYTFPARVSSSVQPGEYNVFIVAAPCNSSGKILDNWSTFDPPSTLLPFTIKSKASSAVNINNCSVTLSSTSYDYDGTEKKPIVTVTYENRTLSEGIDYTVSYSEGRIEPGTYEVTVTGKGSFTGSVTKSFTINYATGNISDCVITLSNTSFIYDGDAQTPRVTVKMGSKLLKNGTDYTLSYSSGRVDVGTYQVTITGRGKYEGSITKEFSIVPSYVGDWYFELDKTTYTYNGSRINPEIITSCDESNYDVEYSNNVNIGKATVTIIGINNCEGTITRTFNITPKGTTIKRLAAGKKAFTVNWNAQKYNTSGYQLRYSTKSSMASAKTSNIGINSVSKKVSNLKAKTKYYVQIRTYKTVNGTKYYSRWSSAKSVKTK